MRFFIGYAPKLQLRHLTPTSAVSLHTISSSSSSSLHTASSRSFSSYNRTLATVGTALPNKDYGKRKGGRYIKTPRIRLHVNPLLQVYKGELDPTPVHPGQIFFDPSLPLHLDLGSERGGWVIAAAADDNKRNFLGVEIRERLVRFSQQQAQDIPNASFLWANVMAHSGEALLDSVRSWGGAHSASIFFPDPWFKSRHSKRRMFDASLLAKLERCVVPGGLIYLATDVINVFDEVVETFGSSFNLRELREGYNLRVVSPSIKTEREASVEARNLPVYRTAWKVLQNPHIVAHTDTKHV